MDTPTSGHADIDNDSDHARRIDGYFARVPAVGAV